MKFRLVLFALLLVAPSSCRTTTEPPPPDVIEPTSKPSGTPSADAEWEALWRTETREGPDRRYAYVDSVPGMRRDLRDAILDGGVMIGMIDEHVLASWGRPWRTHYMDTADGPAELWIYGPPRRKALVLYQIVPDGETEPTGILLDIKEQ